MLFLKAWGCDVWQWLPSGWVLCKTCDTPWEAQDYVEGRMGS